MSQRWSLPLWLEPDWLCGSATFNVHLEYPGEIPPKIPGPTLSFWKPLRVFIFSKSPIVTITASLGTRLRDGIRWVSLIAERHLLRATKRDTVEEYRRRRAAATWEPREAELSLFTLSSTPNRNFGDIALDHTLSAVSLKSYPIWLYQHPICVARQTCSTCYFKSFLRTLGRSSWLGLYGNFFLLSCHKNLWWPVYLLWVYSEDFCSRIER